VFILNCVHELVTLGYSPVFVLNCCHACASSVIPCYKE